MVSTAVCTLCSASLIGHSALSDVMANLINLSGLVSLLCLANLTLLSDLICLFRLVNLTFMISLFVQTNLINLVGLVNYYLDYLVIWLV